MLEGILTVFVLAGSLPLLAGCYQFALAGLHRFRLNTTAARSSTSRTSRCVVPAWNEAFVIGRTIDTLLALDYPRERLRVYVVDDASTDETPDVVRAKAAKYPGRVFHLRREKGGEGKAHTLNHGLRIIRTEGWYEAVLVIDADVIFTYRSLRRMVRHLGDPTVGAVTGYIKEGSRPANFMNRFISFEYIGAQAGARRAQNVLGAQACLAGGAQLLRRESLEAIGGEIDTSSLAEDTFTTFNVQLAGKRVVFEPHAIVWAEEPRDIAGLWKQRLRWGRGNVQVTLRYRHTWLRRGKGKLGGISFALIWFSVFLMPALMVLSSASLVTLFVLDRDAVARRVPLAVGAEPRDLRVRDALRVRPGRPGGAAQLARGDHLPGPDQPGDHRRHDRRRRCSTGCPTGCCCSPTSGCRPRCSPPTWCGGSRRIRGVGRLARPAAVRGRLRAAALRDHRRRLRGRDAARRDALGEDREDRRGGGPGVTDGFERRLAADERFERLLFWRQLAIVVVVAVLIAILVIVS